MKRSISGSTSPVGHAKGFILVAVLLLVALVTVLVVVTSLLARVERNAVTNETNTELARQNALFGLNVALAQLQKATGPDQSVTARADILDTNVGSNYDAAKGVVGVADPYWTGAWKSYNPTSNALQTLDVDLTGSATASTTKPVLRNWSTGAATGLRPAATNLNMDWLVSGEAADHVNAVANGTLPKIIPTTWTPRLVSGSGQARTGVVVAKNLPDLSATAASSAATPAPTVNVAVPLVAIQSQATAPSATAPAIGQYAYWVADEGIKAKVNVGDRTLGASSTSFTQNQLHFLAPQSIISNAGLLASNTYDLRLPTPPPAGSPYPLLNVTTLQSIGNVFPSPTPSPSAFAGSAANQFAGDVTTYSMGVLSDTRNGGLKRDLTAAFEDTTFQQYNNLLASCSLGASPDFDAQSVFRVTGAIPPQSSSYMTTKNPATLDGLRWRSLLFFYDLYKPTMGSPPYASIGPSGPAPSGTSTTSSPNNITGIGSFASSNPPTPYSVDMRYPQWSGAAPPLSIASKPQDTGFGMDYILPALVGLQMDIVLGAVPEPGTSNYFLLLQYRPSAVYWNPYSVQLKGNFNGKPPSFSLTTNMLGGNQITYAVTNSVTGAPEQLTGPNPILLSGPSTTDSSGNVTTPDFTFSIDPPSMSSMDPGEVRFFGLDATKQNSTLAGSVAPALPNLKSNPNVSQDYYVSYQIKSKSATGSFSGSDSFQITAPSSQSMFANRLSQNISGVSGWPDSSTGASGRYNNSGLPSVNPAKNATGGTAVWPNLTVSSLASNPMRIVGYYARTKGLVSSLPAPTGSAIYKYKNQTYDIPMFMGNAMEFLPTDNSQSNQLFELYAQAYDPFLAGSLELSTFTSGGTGNAYLDTYYGAASLGVIGSPKGVSPTKTVLYDIPTQPMVSLGQFMHLEPRYYNDSGSWGHQQWPAMAIGGGLASPDVPLNTNNTSAIAASLQSSVLFYDFSFMANQALFDSYFFSTVPAGSTPTTNQYTDGSLPYSGDKFTQAYVQQYGALANGRMRYSFKNGVAPTVSALRGTRSAAANLMVDGAFNVNSTSVKAWTALLSSLKGNDLKLWDPIGNGATNYAAASLLNPIPRFLSSAGSAALDQPWSGMRALTDPQVKDLATQIVQQVKIRGPFLDMADFLNRRLAGTTDENTMGALQNAIENNTTNINQKTRALGVTPTSYTTINSAVGAATTFVPKNTAVGMPGDLMQQDLVQAFAPVMTARSDTFVVRCYGETNNPKSLDSFGYPKAQARAWGEAVVQRLPEYIDQTDAKLYSINSPALQALGDSTPVNSVGAVNATFGRRYKVVSFRWLNESDL